MSTLDTTYNFMREQDRDDARGLVLSLMTINQGGEAKAVLDSIFTAFNSFNSPDPSNPLPISTKITKFMDSAPNIGAATTKLATTKNDDVGNVADKGTTFYFPLPTKIEESYSQTYETNAISVAELALKKGAGKVVGMIANAFGKQSINHVFSDSIEQAEHYMRRDNKLLDQNILSTYAGSVPRSISLTFTFIPDSAKHTKSIIEGVNALKAASRATVEQVSIAGMNTNTLSQKYVATFQMQVDKSSKLEAKNLGMLNNIISSKSNTSFVNLKTPNKFEEENTTDIVSSGYFINSVDISYGADGSMALYADDMVKELTISISLVERKPMYRHNYLSNYKAAMDNVNKKDNAN